MESAGRGETEQEEASDHHRPGWLRGVEEAQETSAVHARDLPQWTPTNPGTALQGFVEVKIVRAEAYHGEVHQGIDEEELQRR